MELNQLLDLVAQEQKLLVDAAQLQPQARQRVEQVGPLQLARPQAQTLQPLFGVQDGVAQLAVQLADVAGALEVPEHGEVRSLRRRRRDVFELLQDRGLADPARAQEPDGVPVPLQDLLQKRRASVELLPPDPLTDHIRSRRHRPQASAMRPTASTSAMVMRRRLSSCMRFTREMQVFWMRYGLQPVFSMMRSTAPRSSRKMPWIGFSISSSASRRVNGRTSISSKKLYQGLPSLAHCFLMPTPLTTATRSSAKLFMKRLRSLWLTRGS